MNRADFSDERQKAEQKLADEVTADFERRREERKRLERAWELNMNFLSGNQYCGMTASGELEEEQPQYWWMTRRVFNHIAPTIDTRMARLAKVRPALTVRAFSDSQAEYSDGENTCRASESPLPARAS